VLRLGLFELLICLQLPEVHLPRELDHEHEALALLLHALDDLLLVVADLLHLGLAVRVEVLDVVLHLLVLLVEDLVLLLLLLVIVLVLEIRFQLPQILLVVIHQLSDFPDPLIRLLDLVVIRLHTLQQQLASLRGRELRLVGLDL